MKRVAQLLRVKHYIKNLLVFAPLACSGGIFNLRKLLASFLGFIAFCAVSSCVYIINDICDADKDRQHPEKCKRPIASGDISVKQAKIILAVAIAVTAIISVFTFSIKSCALIVLYFAINITYSNGLKNIPVVDVVILASGFVIRLLYGSVLSGIELSSWLLLTVMSAAFFFSFGKRRNEIKMKSENEAVDNTREVLKHYPEAFLDKTMYMCLGITNVFYTLWSVNDTTALHYNSKYLFWTAPVVLIITIKYALNIENESHGDPVEVLLHDKVLILLCVLYIILMFTILYIF